MNSVIPNFRACIIFESISYKGFGSDLFQKKKKKRFRRIRPFPKKKKKVLEDPTFQKNKNKKFRIIPRFSDPDHSLNYKRKRFKVFKVEPRSNRDDIIINLIIN